MIKLWIIAIIAFLGLEAVTLGLTSVWFAIGSLAALLSATFDAPPWLQMLCFVLVSALSLAATRPLAKKYLNDQCEPTNADRVIGAHGVVTETIDNLRAVGAVSVDGKVWTARALDDTIVIEAGTKVRIEKISGVKLLVTIVQ